MLSRASAVGVGLCLLSGRGLSGDGILRLQRPVMGPVHRGRDTDVLGAPQGRSVLRAE